MCIDVPVHGAAVYQALQEDGMTQVSLNAVKVETGSAVQGEPQRVARVNVSARRLATLVVAAATGGKVALLHVQVLRIEAMWRAVWQTS